MRVVIRGHEVTLADKSLIGEGGEARVFGWNNKAVKIYHRLGAHDLQRRAAKLADFPSGLPASVCGPETLVFSKKADVIGFVMPWVEDGLDIRLLSRPHWRDRAGFTQLDVRDLFRNLHRLLDALHARNVVVGDLNDGNVLFDARTPFLIDADSMQFGAHACIVGHEKFLDPRLFGTDLTATQAFTPETDWYAFNVLLFSSLLGVHPYGGVHAGYPTLLRRAEAAHSILRPDVKRPKAALRFDVLPPELLDHFAGVFDRRKRGRFPERLLEMTWPACDCGLEHARARCPACASAGALSRRPAVRTRGRVRASRVSPDDIRPRPLTTSPVRITDDWLVERATGRRIGTVVGTLTVHFVFDPTAGRLRNVDLPAIHGRILDVDAVFDDDHVLVTWIHERPESEPLHDTRLRGAQTAACYLIHRDGRIIAQATGSPTDSPLLAHARGKAVRGSHVLVATDDGLASYTADGGALIAGRLFTDTESFVRAGDELIAAAGGSVFVKHSSEVLHLEFLPLLKGGTHEHTPA